MLLPSGSRAANTLGSPYQHARPNMSQRSRHANARQFLRVLAPILRSITRTRTGTLQGRQPSCDQTYGGAGHAYPNAADTLMSSITLCATWQLKARHIELLYLKTDLMTADIFTKPLGPTRFRFLRDRLLGITTMGGDKHE